MPETWKWHQSVCLVETHRLICNMTLFDLLGSSRDLDLRSNFENDLSLYVERYMIYSIYIYIRIVSTRQTRWWQNHCGIFHRKEVIHEKRLCRKNGIFYLHDLWSLNRWPEIKSDGNIAIENFKSYRLLFPFLSSYFTSRDNRRYLKQSPRGSKYGKIWPLVTSGDLNIDLT